MPQLLATAEEGVRAILAASTHVTNFVSTRIRPHVAAQADTMPYLSYERISTERWPHYSGPTAIAAPLIQVNGWSATAAELANIAYKVRLVLNGTFPGAVAVGTNSVTIQAIWLNDERDIFEPPRDASDQPSYGFQMDFKVYHQEAVS